MRSILAGVAAGIVVSVLLLAAIVLSLPAGPVLRATPPAPTLPVSTAPSAPSLSPVPSASGTAPAGSPGGSIGAGLRVGDQAPALVVDRLGGGQIDRTTLSGPLWVNFTASWCPTCRDELRLLQRFQSALGSRITILVIDVREPQDVVAALVRDVNITLPVGLDQGRAERDWAAYALPVHYWLDGDGRVRGFVYGGAGPDQFLEGVRKVVPGAQVDLGS